MIPELIFFTLSSVLCVTIAKYLKPHPHKIRDLIHENFPFFSHCKYFSDILIFNQVAYFLTTLTLTDVEDSFLILGSAQCLRALTMSFTILPPLRHAKQKVRFGGLNGNGTEYIFSGHAVYACLSFLHLYPKIGLILIPYNLLSQLMIILSHNHYTVDVLLSWIITPLLYVAYHK